jgi:DNA repair exonuclease SbcCD ATPase subunit
MLLSHDQVLAELDNQESRLRARIGNLKANLQEAEKVLDEIKNQRSLASSYKLLHDHIASLLPEIPPPAHQVPNVILDPEEAAVVVSNLEAAAVEAQNEVASLTPPVELQSADPSNFLTLLKNTP